MCFQVMKTTLFSNKIKNMLYLQYRPSLPSRIFDKNINKSSDLF